MTKGEKEANRDALVGLFGGLFFDAWIIMLALGALAEREHWPRIALGYFSVLLINIIAIAVLPQGLRLAAFSRQILRKMEGK